MKNIVINGFGRIGRLAFRELAYSDQYKIIGISSRSTPEELAYLLKYDTVYKTFGFDEISYNEEGIVFNGTLIKSYIIKDDEDYPWKELNVDCVLECSGAFTKVERAMKHINNGAKHVIISAPGKGDMKTIVYGVNHHILNGDELVISASSCTTNCLAPVLDILNKNIGIESGYMTTVHAMTNDQVTADGSHSNGIHSRRGRAASQNIIPTSTGAAGSIGKVIPELEGILDGSSFRVPVADGSIIDLTLNLNRETSIEELNNIFENNQSEVLKYTTDPIVSSDVIGLTCGALVDGQLTNVLEKNKKLAKIIAWYDNEYGYISQMLRTMDYLLKKI